VGIKQWIDDNILGSGEAAHARTVIKQRPSKIDDEVEKALNGGVAPVPADKGSQPKRVGTTTEWKKP
jgi:hypothetical protein